MLYYPDSFALSENFTTNDPLVLGEDAAFLAFFGYYTPIIPFTSFIFAA